MVFLSVGYLTSKPRLTLLVIVLSLPLNFPFSCRTSRECCSELSVADSLLSLLASEAIELAPVVVLFTSGEIHISQVWLFRNYDETMMNVSFVREITKIICLGVFKSFPLV